MAFSPWLVYLATVGLSVDYNVTCPDNRLCQVLHKYQSPCPFWDCSACWWHYPNCTKTDEAPSTHCPYVKCSDLPTPSHSHVVTAVLSTITVVLFVSLFGRYLFRRFCRQHGPDPEAERETSEDEEVTERVPLLQRCRNYLSTQPISALDRFRSTLSARTRTGPVSIPRPPMEMQEQPVPSAPPAYEDIDQPILRTSTGPRTLQNPTYQEPRQSHSLSSPQRVLEPLDIEWERRRVLNSRLEEVPLQQGGQTQEENSEDKRE